jgi:hypothetical protein
MDELYYGFLGGYTIVMNLLSIALMVLLIVAWWKLFEKAGEHGWAAIIPFYNTYVLYKISGKTKLFWAYLPVYIITVIAAIVFYVEMFVLLGVSLYSINYYGSHSSLGSTVAVSGVVFVISLLFFVVGTVALFVLKILQSIGLVKNFGLSGGYAAGIIFLPHIFYCMLAFSSKIRYVGGSSGYGYAPYGMQGGYIPQNPQNGYASQNGYAPQGAQSGYAPQGPQSGFAPQNSYAQQTPQNGGCPPVFIDPYSGRPIQQPYGGQPGYGAQPGYGQQQPYSGQVQQAYNGQPQQPYNGQPQQGYGQPVYSQPQQSGNGQPMYGQSQPYNGQVQQPYSNQPGFNQTQQVYINPYIQPGMPTQPEAQFQPEVKLQPDVEPQPQPVPEPEAPVQQEPQFESQEQQATQQIVNSCETAETVAANTANTVDTATADAVATTTAATDEPITAPTESADTADTADFTGTAAFGSEHEEKI